MEAIQPERLRGQRQHAEAIETGTTCIACHYNLVHKDVEPSEEFLQAITPKQDG
jgi:nitrate/TMAO reductase-like tetraheme cytochrome c subunit